MPSPASYRKSLIIVLPLALLAAALAVVVFHAQHTLNLAGNTAASAHQIPFTLRPLDPATLAAANPGFEPVAAPANDTTGLIFQNQLYLAGPAGLSIAALASLESTDTPRRTLRTGIELPVAPITAIATGRLRGATEPQVLLTTAGAGVLILAGNNVTQLLPQAADARDLTTLLPQPTGDLLLGTRHHGLLQFDGSTLTQIKLPTQATDITALAQTTSAAVLVGTRTAGVFLVNAGTVTQADTTAGLPDNQVETILTNSTTAYIGTPLGVAQIPLDTPAFRPTRTLAPGRFAHTLALTQGTLQVGTLDQGILTVSLTTPTPRLRNISISAPLAPEFASGNTQRIDELIPTASGLLALADGTLQQQTTAGLLRTAPPAATTLADRNISALAFTTQGQLYVGFFDHGLDILNPDQPTTPPRHFEDDHLFCVNRLVLDPTRHTIAAATANGLVLFDDHGTPRQTLTRHDGLISDHITDIAYTTTPAGPQMVVATPAGLTFLTPTGPESLYAFEGLVNNHVYALATENEHLLAGTLGGISILENQQIRRNFTATNSTLKHNWITAILPLETGSRAPGSYLVGTYGAALATLDPDGIFTPIDLPAGTPKDLIINPNALLATPTHIFAGTLSQGMLVLTRATGRWSRVTTGLPSLNVTAFAARAGVLYIGTENGLVRIPEARL